MQRTCTAVAKNCFERNIFFFSRLHNLNEPCGIIYFGLDQKPTGFLSDVFIFDANLFSVVDSLFSLGWDFRHIGGNSAMSQQIGLFNLIILCRILSS